MGAFFALIFFLLLACELFAPLILALQEALGYAFVYLGRCLWITAKSLTLLLKDALVYLWRNGKPALRFLGYLVQELLRDDEAEPEKADQSRSSHHDSTGQQGHPTPYATACQQLGLPAQFTQAEFKLAYRRAIRAAHPDRGGREADAQAVNAAVQLIKSRHGWR